MTTSEGTIKKDELVRALHSSDWDSANGPVFVKIIAHEVTLWIEIIDIERPGPTVPPWEDDAIVLVSRPFYEKGVRATMPRLSTMQENLGLHTHDTPTVVRARSHISVDPAESHYGFYNSNIHSSGSGRGPEHG